MNKLNSEVTLDYRGYVDNNDLVHYMFSTKEFGNVYFVCKQDWLHHPNTVIVLLELQYAKQEIKNFNPPSVYTQVQELLELATDSDWVSANMIEWLGLYKIKQAKALQEQVDIINMWCKEI